MVDYGGAPWDVRAVNEAVREYVDAIPAASRPLFDRLHDLILAAYPGAAVVLSYRMPTYRVGDRRLYVAAWKHGVSIYGWQQDRNGGFVDRHPTFSSGRGTIRLRPEDAAGIADDELSELLRGALDP